MIEPFKFHHAFMPQGGHDALRSLRLNYRVLRLITVILLAFWSTISFHKASTAIGQGEDILLAT